MGGREESGLDTGELDMAHLRQWIGRSEVAEDIVTPQAIRRLRATLFRDPVDRDEAPLTMHWTLAPPAVPHGDLAADGHPERGDFLPPVPLPARMWAGGRLEFFDRLRAGDTVRRTSRIESVVEKQGSTGALCFVAVAHHVESPRGLAVRERQDLVYRNLPARAAAAGPAKASPPAPARHRRTHPADEVALFRYSALTFNGHRIHYDRPYATDAEGYPALVVHGPLQAALMSEFAADVGGRMPASFDYRGVAPLFAGEDFSINANDTEGGLDIWTAGASGAPAMRGTARW